MSCKSLEEWLDWIENCHSSEIELGLDRCRRVLKRLLNKPLKCPVITVAGTNGKGSTVAVLESLALQANKTVVVYTSPHFLDYRERLRLNGQWLSKEQHCLLFEAIDIARESDPLTYFEFATLSAFKCAEINQPDLLILETGLGGRLDAVNIIEADIGIITTVDYDHQDWLGNDLTGIAREKAGIIHPEKIAIIADPLFPAEIIDEICNKTNNVYLAGKQFKHQDFDFDWTWTNQKFGPWHLNSLNFPSSNASAAIQAWVLLFNQDPLSEIFIQDALSNIQLSGRFEVVAKEPLVILDVAHNPQAFRTQLGFLKREKCFGKTHFVLGMLDDKNSKACIDEIKSMVDYWYLSDVDTERGIASDKLKDLVIDGEKSSKVVGCYSSPFEAYTAATENVDTIDRIIVTGSFYTVAPILKIFQLSQ